MEFLQNLSTSLFNQLSSKLTSTYLVHDLISDHVPNTIIVREDNNNIQPLIFTMEEVYFGIYI
jgi:hypothetical protein